MDGGATDTRGLAAGERREGGKGMLRARLNCEMQRWSWARTWRRVRRRGRAGGSGGEMVWDVDARWDCLRIVGELGSCSFFSFSSGGASMLSRPLGTKCRICGWRVPRDESVSARERVSPRRSSTS